MAPPFLFVGYRGTDDDPHRTPIALIISNYINHATIPAPRNCVLSLELVPRTMQAVARKRKLIYYRVILEKRSE